MIFENYGRLHCKNLGITHARKELFEKLYNCNSQWLNLSLEDKFTYLLTAIDLDFNFYFSIFLDKIYKICKESYKTK